MEPTLSVESPVSIPYWVFSSLQHSPVIDAQGDTVGVSIPYWVFSSLQRADFQGHPVGDEVSIPYWVFSSLQPEPYDLESNKTKSFNPLLGFLLVATGLDNLLRLDGHGVSIPYWVFSSLQLSRSATVVALRVLFQSLTGFSPRCNAINNPATAMRIEFQSLTGFSPRCNGNTRP